MNLLLANLNIGKIKNLHILSCRSALLLAFQHIVGENLNILEILNRCYKKLKAGIIKSQEKSFNQRQMFGREYWKQRGYGLSIFNIIKGAKLQKRQLLKLGTSIRTKSLCPESTHR